MPSPPPCRRSAADPVAPRRERPTAALADVVTGYRRHVVDGADWSLPREATIRIALDHRPAELTIGRRAVPLPSPAMLIGPTSLATRFDGDAAAAIEIGIAATGWARLFPVPAAALADEALPLAVVLGPSAVDALLAVVDDWTAGEAIAPTVEAWLADLLRPPRADAAQVARCAALLDGGEIDSVAALAAALDLEQPRLRRLAMQHFGFPAKRLLRRARFLRSLDPYLGGGPRSIATTYFDLSHFLRESRDFLGMTPRQFAALTMPPA